MTESKPRHLPPVTIHPLKGRPETGILPAGMIIHRSRVSVLRSQVRVFSIRYRFRPVPAPEPEDLHLMPDQLRPGTRSKSIHSKGNRRPDDWRGHEVGTALRAVCSLTKDHSLFGQRRARRATPYHLNFLINRASEPPGLLCAPLVPVSPCPRAPRVTR